MMFSLMRPPRCSSRTRAFISCSLAKARSVRHLGEVDLVAKDGDVLVFIEIKTRKGRPLGFAKEAVNARKRKQISKVALNYMKTNNCCDVSARFDVVAVSVGSGPPQIEVIKNAFDLAYG